MENNDHAILFARLKKLLLPYSKKMEVRTDTASNYHLYIVKEIVLAGKKVAECYFCGLKINHSMVSFYFFPYYSHPQVLSVPPSIQKNLKGKTCFNFKQLNSGQEEAIAALLKDGEMLYKKEHIL
ncbi:MAG: hypothetical protein ABIU63_01015 [Chitinophagaceae bacterium]